MQKMPPDIRVGKSCLRLHASTPAPFQGVLAVLALLPCPLSRVRILAARNGLSEGDFEAGYSAAIRRGAVRLMQNNEGETVLARRRA